MHSAETNPDEREQRLDEAVTSWLRANEQGAAPDPRVWLDRYPDLAEDLQAFFNANQCLGQAAAPWREAQTLNTPLVASPGDAETRGRGGEATPASLRERRLFGEYELLAEIARGGMGVVYKARQTRLNRTVAVKMILAGELANHEDVHRFLAEAEAAAGLDHPGIVPVYESGEIGGQQFFSMGFVDGQSLAALLAAGPLPPRRAAELLALVADAVEYAHQQGVIHRDLKPGNILLDKDGRPRVTDFGLAKRVAGDSGLTHTGQALGTPSYMPPEQASGKLDAVGPVSDVYALGAVLYATLTGRPPFQSANPLDTLLQVLEEEPVAPRQLNPEVPRDLETVALKCLEKEAHKRYAHASELADELRRFLRGEPIHARPVGRWEHGWRWCRRNPVVAALAATVLLTLLGGVGGSTYFALQSGERAEIADQNAIAFKTSAQEAKDNADESRRHAARAEKAKQSADRERGLALASARETKHALYLARINLAQLAWNQGQMARVDELLKATMPANGADDSRSFEWYRLWRLCHRDRLTLRTDGGVVVAVALSPDGATAAIVPQMGPIQLWDAAAGRLRTTLAGHPGPTRCVAFSPDGTLIASAGADGAARLWQVESGDEQAALPNHRVAATSVAFSPDGTMLATGEFGPRVRVWSVHSGELLRTLEGHRGYASNVAFSPDGKLLAAGGEFEGAGQVMVWHADSGELAADRCPKSQQPVPSKAPTGFLWGAVSCLTYSHDGKTLAVGFGRSVVNSAAKQHVTLFDAATGREVAILEGHSEPITAIAAAPSGEKLTTASVDGTARTWNVASREVLATYRGHVGAVSSLALSNDGRTLITGGVDGTAKVWDTAPQPEVPWPWQHGYPTSVAFSPDGTRFATARQDGLIEFWDRATARKQGEFKGAGIVSAVAFSPAGTLLASGSLDGTLTLWNLETANREADLSGHSAGITELAFSPDGSMLVSASKDKTARVWDVGQRGAIGVPLDHPNFVSSVAFSPDGKQFATACGEPIYQFNKAAEVRIYDAGSRQPRTTFSDFGGGGPTSLAFSSDGRTLAVAVSDSRSATRPGRVVLFDVASGAKGRELTGYQGLVWCVRFSPDGRCVATGDSDKLIKLRDVKTGEERAVYSGHTLPVVHLEFAPDGGALVSASNLGDPQMPPTQSGGEVKVWHAALPAEVDERRQ